MYTHRLCGPAGFSGRLSEVHVKRSGYGFWAQPVLRNNFPGKLNAISVLFWTFWRNDSMWVGEQRNDCTQEGTLFLLLNGIRNPTCFYWFSGTSASLEILG